jgi:hypothetical protein
VAEEAADEADVFGGDGLVAGDGGFATGEGDEVVVAEGGEFGQVDRGEPIGDQVLVRARAQSASKPVRLAHLKAASELLLLRSQSPRHN